jgi:general secretion pathway protein A
VQDAPAEVQTVTDPELAQRIAVLEARAEEQEATLRRVLTLLVEWVEKEQPEAAYKVHAA